MPKFLVTSGSYFQPFTYDELAKPIAHAVEAHNATQDVYDQLSMETSALGRYITENPGDSDAKKLYDDYLSKLNSLQDNLWRKGYNASTRRDLSAARAGYASDITRLQSAIKSRQERSKEYWDAKHKNPNLVTGTDPGLGGLNDYLRDENYGTNWFSYDSAQFEKEVSDEMKQRAQRMLRGLTDPNGVVKNPALKAVLTRVLDKGLTNEEVDSASALVDEVIDLSPEQREAYYANVGASPVIQMMAESFINRYDATGIRGYDVSDSEKTKLRNRGKAGFVGGVMAPDVKDFTDPEFEFQMKMREARAKAAIELETEREKAKIKAEAEGTNILRPVDTDTQRAPGDNYGKAKKQYDKEFGQLKRPIIRPNKEEVDSVERAAEIVFSGDIRRNVYKKIGIDVGRNPNSLTESGYLTGIAVGADGKEYEVQYNPKARIDGDSERGGIRYRPVGSKTDWSSCPYSKEWTRDYRVGRRQYEQFLDEFKTKEKDLYDAAKKLDPDKQYKIYERDNINFMTPLTDYASVQFNKPDNNPDAVFNKHYVAQNGTDAGKLTLRLSGYLSNHLGFDGGVPVKDPDIKTYHNTSHGIHRVSKAGGLSQDAVQAGDAFRFDEDGNITNAKGVIVTPESIMDLGNDGSFGSGYIILNTSKGMFSVNIDMFDSDRLRSLFTGKGGAQERMLRAMMNPEFSDDDIEMELNDITDDLVRDIQSLIGIDLTTKSSTGTAGKNDE